MIYATMIVGEEYCKKYYPQVLEASSSNEVYILTDHPELFPECNTVYYNKDVFSYFDKLIFLAELTLEKKKRVTFIDCDWFKNLGSSISIKEDTFYTYWVYTLSDLKGMTLYEFGVDLMIKVLNDNGYKVDYEDYIGEAVLSLPYSSKVESVLEDLIALKSPWEKAFSQSIDTEHSTLLRYSKYGVGYAEGGALTAVLRKHSIPYEGVTRWGLLKHSMI